MFAILLGAAVVAVILVFIGRALEDRYARRREMADRLNAVMGERDESERTISS